MGYTIRAQSRGKENATHVRLNGMVPGVIYGPDRKSTSISVDARELEKLYEQAGESSLIEFILDDEKPVQVLIQDIQTEPIKGHIIHIDFLQSKVGSKLDVVIALNFVGESMAVKQGGTLTKAIEEVKASCLPKDLISSLDVDISVLKTLDDSIAIKDLPLSKDIELSEDPDSLVVKVAPALSAEQLKQREEASESSAPPAEAPEVEGEKKEESDSSEEKK